MRVDRALLDDLAAQLSALGDAAESELMARLALSWREHGGSRRYVESMRDIAASAMAANCESFGMAALSVGLATMDETCGEPLADVLPQVIEKTAEGAEGSARYWAKFLDGTDEGFERFLAGVCAKTRRDVEHMADRGVSKAAAAANRGGRGKGRGIRFARVPRGPSCGFCIMLASRGFVYATRETAGEFARFHDRCDCRVVAGRAGTTVEGYDPDGLYDRYLRCAKAVNGGRPGSGSGPIRDEWERMPEFERARWGKRTRGGKDDFNDYYAHRVCQEMDTRDREWLWSGKVPEVDYTSCSRKIYGTLQKESESFNPGDYKKENVIDRGPEWMDLFAHDALANSGFNFATRPQSALDAKGKVIEGVTTPDGRIGKVMWEIKSPRDGVVPHKPKNDLKFIEQAFRESRGNFRNPYDETSLNGMGDMSKQAKLVLNTRYRTIASTDDEVAAEVGRRAKMYEIECLWIDKNGSIRRFMPY